MSRLRLHRFSQGKPCFFCGAPGPNSKEHTRPRAFFEGTECSKITVPACPKHNTDKAGTDNAIKAALLRGIDEMVASGAKKDVPDAVLRSIEAMQPKYRQANRLVTMKPLISDHPDDTDVALPFLAKAAEVESWVKLLTAALLWSVTGTHDTASDWDNASAFSPSYFPGSRNVDLTPELLAEAYERNLYTWRNLEESGTWRHGWQPEPVAFPGEIYRFDVCLATSNGRRAAVFKHHFFSAHPYYVWFETSAETISSMEKYLEAEAGRLRTEGNVLTPALLPPARYRKS
jgi:hypothetical protein